MHYYNEFDPQAAAWLQVLIDQHLIPEGVVDTRSIVEVTAADLGGFVQCHFFAGIGGWPLALQLAGVPTSTRLWTGSCPCQPFSVAGGGKGTADERHLWPVFFDLIRACNPSLVFGEQVASAAVLGSSAKPTKRSAGKAVQPVWLDGVFADLESAGYACGSSDIPAAGVGAPHIRQRCWWGAVRMADASEQRREGRAEYPAVQGTPAESCNPRANGSNDSRLVHTTSGGLGIIRDATFAGSCGHAHGSGEHGGMGNSNGGGRQSGSEAAETAGHRHSTDSASFWNDSYWHPCRDGKYRRVPTQSVHEFVVDGIPAFMGDGWNPCLEEIQKTIESHASITNSNPVEILRTLWENIRAETIQKRMGGSDSLPRSEILLIALLCIARNQRQEFELSASDLSEMEKGLLRVLRNETGEFETASCSPHQRGLDGPPSGKSQNALCRLPSEASSVIDSETLHPLPDARQEERNVSEALAEIQKVWRCHADEGSDSRLSRDLRIGSGILVASCGFPLANPECFRTDRRRTVRPPILRGAGNAICPEVGAEFVKAFYEVITP